jgi:excisionase family DNA binding protein
MSKADEKEVRDELLSVKQVAKELGVSVETVEREIRDGNLLAHKVRGQWRIRRSALDKYLAERSNIR